MDGVLKHKVHEVGIGLNEFVQALQILKFFALLLVENVKVVLIRIEFHVFDGRLEVIFLVDDLPVTLLEFFLFLLETPDLFVNLLLHHLVEVLLLDL